MCKLSKFNNCDPETQNQEYCIFHKPNKNEAEAKEFYRKLKAYFLENEQWFQIKGKEIRRNIFSRELNFSGYVFPKLPEGFESPFSNAVFLGNVNFDEAVFEGEADFWNAKFEGNASFVKTTFNRNAVFLEAIFESYADFSEAVFKEKADFWEVLFKKDAIFWETKFLGDAIFLESVFKGKADFSLASFNYASFASEEWFYWFTIEDIETEKHRIIKFLHTEHNFDLRNYSVVVERNRVIINETIKNAEINITPKEAFLVVSTPSSKKIYPLKLVFSENKRKIFAKRGFRFFNELNFSGVTFNIIDIDIPSDCFRLPSAEAEACRVQRISYEKQGKKSELEKIFVRERRALRKARVWNSLENFYFANKLSAKGLSLLKFLFTSIASLFEFFIADLSCEYGTNWIRPILLWFAVVVFIFPFLYFYFDALPGASYLDYIYFSGITATTVGYGDFVPFGISRILAMIEAVFGLFVWAIFLTVFARKYMV